MKNIDFLPESYKQRLRLRRARVWWGIVGTTFGMAIAASATAQWGLAKSVERQLRMVESHAPAAMEQEQLHSKLQGEVNRGGDLAALCVYLQHPWPRTQILAAVTSPLPEGVQLTDLRIRQETSSAVDSLSARKPPSAKPENGEKPLAGPAADLARLRADHDHLHTVIELVGETQDAAALHRYVAALGKNELLTGARLKSLETGEAGDRTSARFELRVQVRPGYGQPGGPECADAPPATAEPKAAGDAPAQAVESPAI